MLRLAMRRAKTQKMVFYEGGDEQGNSSRRKSRKSGGTIVIVDDASGWTHFIYTPRIVVVPIFPHT